MVWVEGEYEEGRTRTIASTVGTLHENHSCFAGGTPFSASTGNGEITNLGLILPLGMMIYLIVS